MVRSEWETIFMGTWRRPGIETGQAGRLIGQDLDIEETPSAACGDTLGLKFNGNRSSRMGLRGSDPLDGETMGRLETQQRDQICKK